MQDPGAMPPVTGLARTSHSKVSLITHGMYALLHWGVDTRVEGHHMEE